MRTMGGFSQKLAVNFLTIGLVILSLPCGSYTEIPPKPPGSVTVLPPVKPAGGPQAFPDAENSNLPVFTMDYARIQVPFEVTLWVLLASFAKIGKQSNQPWTNNSVRNNTR